ncbi:hypothetical protein FKW77_008233 [Venturia effusa]|uniref:DUF4536 domain-containing protein n=1 Tax=Venturia effusa TaxID=50376 RepID=A0A517KWZ5_9PEZI|nr:hypothetical protein FKW77_008233 [Venturia effusa]
MSSLADIQKAYDKTVPKLKDTLAADRDQHDCFSCRVIGSLYKSFTMAFRLTDSAAGAATFVGLGGFTYVTGHAQLRKSQAQILKSGSRMGMAPRRAGITFMSIGMAAIGLYRLVN